MQLSPQTIIQHCNKSYGEPLITPFRSSYKHSSGLSGGLSCAGYDVHISKAVNVIKHGQKIFMRNIIVYEDGFTLPANTGCLGITMERFSLPDDICMNYINKSTLARQFIDASATLAEPGWCGHLTLEIKNNADVDQYIAYGQPIGQVVFHQLDQPSEQPYNGKYQNAGAVPQGAK